MALGGELHADEEATLLEQGARQADLWGINIYPDLPADERIEYDSMINVRPAQGNRSRLVDDRAIRQQARPGAGSGRLRAHARAARPDARRSPLARAAQGDHARPRTLTRH